MVRIKIDSPDEIRREVNAIKQVAATNNANSNSSSSSNTDDTGPLYWKRRALSYSIEIDFNRCGHPEDQKKIQAEDLVTLLKCCCSGKFRLESISLEDVRVEGNFQLVLNALLGNDDDGDAIAAGDGAGKFLRSFTAYQCRITEDTGDLCNLGKALAAGCPRLEAIAFGFSAMKHQPALMIVAPILFKSESQLRKIFLNGFSISGITSNTELAAAQEEQREPNVSITTSEQVETFFLAMRMCTKLQRALIYPMITAGIKAEELCHVADLLKHNLPALQTLQLHMDMDDKDWHLSDCAVALQHNTTLKRLVVEGPGTPGSDPAAWGRKILTEVTAFHTCLRDYNFTLEEVLTGGASGKERWTLPTRGETSLARDIQEQLNGINFLLSLNRMGRRKLLSPLKAPGGAETNNSNGSTSGNAILASTDEWMEAIANKDDPSMIFYFLQKNPSLCFPSYDDDDKKPSSKQQAQAPERGLGFESPIASTLFSRLANKVSPELPAVASTLADSPLAIRGRARKKRSREEAFGGDDTGNGQQHDNETGLSRSTVVDPSDIPSRRVTTPLRVAQNAAVCAAVFAAGFVTRGYVDQQP